MATSPIHPFIAPAHTGCAFDSTGTPECSFVCARHLFCCAGKRGQGMAMVCERTGHEPSTTRARTRQQPKYEAPLEHDPSTNRAQGFAHEPSISQAQARAEHEFGPGRQSAKRLECYSWPRRSTADLVSSFCLARR